MSFMNVVHVILNVIQYQYVLLQVTHQYVPVDADLVLSQDELQLGVKLIQHLTSRLSSLLVQAEVSQPAASPPALS